MNRLDCITVKVNTPFWSLYAHIEFDKNRRPIEISFSSPGKFSETEVGNALNALAAAVNQTLKEERK